MTSNAQVDISTPIPSHITKTQVLSFLHDTTKMLSLNPLISEYKPLPAESALEFYKTVPSKEKPADISSCKLFHITEDSDARRDTSGAWIKKFVPDKVDYESGYENTPTGVITITHAPLSVSSITTWVLNEKSGSMVVDMTGKVQSNIVLMQFIKRSLQGDFQEMVDRFLEALTKDASGEESSVIEKV